MGLPEIQITFIEKGVSAIQRSERGIVVLILNDDTNTDFDTIEYTNAASVKAADWTPENKRFIEMAFWGSPRKVIIERLAVAAADDSVALTRLLTKKWNWVAIPGADTTRTDALVSWIKDKAKPASEGGLDKTFKAVVSNPTAAPEHESIVNFTTDNIVVGTDGKFKLVDHGFVDDNAVEFSGTTLPDGIESGTSYYVVNAEEDLFQVSTTSGGDPVEITSKGEAVVCTFSQVVSINDTTDVITSAGHGLVVDEVIRFSADTLPTGISGTTDYYVISPTTDTFQISETQGGLAFDFSDTGTNVSFEKIRDVVVQFGNVYTSAEYCARIAGLLGGLPLTRSSTYFILSEVVDATTHTDPNGDIDNGELILVNDGENWKIGRGVTSYSSASWVPTKGEQFSKIKVVEGMHLIKDDIRDTFEQFYIGKVINDYDNKMAFFASVNLYFKEIAKPLVPVLDSGFENNIDIDIEKQKAQMILDGLDPEEYSDKEIREYNTGSKVFAAANIKLVDAMEDLYLEITI